MRKLNKNTLQLIGAIARLRNFQVRMENKYGCPSLKQRDTLQYLSRIERLMTPHEVKTEFALSSKRAELTTKCSSLEVDYAIKACKKRGWC